MNGPEERWAQQKEWDEERRRGFDIEDDEERLSKDDIDAIKADEKYDEGR